MKLYVIDRQGVPFKGARGRCACLEVPDENTRFFDWLGLNDRPAWQAARILRSRSRSIGYFSAGAGYLERFAEICGRHPGGTVSVYN